MEPAKKTFEKDKHLSNLHVGVRGVTVVMNTPHIK